VGYNADGWCGREERGGRTKLGGGGEEDAIGRCFSDVVSDLGSVGRKGGVEIRIFWRARAVIYVTSVSRGRSEDEWVKY